MRGRPSPVEALVTLVRFSDATERRASWRQAITALGQNVRVQGPPPLDGMNPDILLRAVRAALETGLADDLDWLAPGPATVALFELSAALPSGRERRDLGRRVAARLYEGTAATFAAVAARMALGSGRQLEAAPLAARVGLVFDLPVGANVNADALALSLVCRRELHERWLVRPSTGPLPARRLAAKLLEHAAREASMRALQGDTYARDVMLGDTLRPSFTRLLLDREPLVWRHAAVARGLLATCDPHLREDIELNLEPALSPTEWRRGAVALVATMVAEPEQALKRCRQLVEGPVARQDPGLLATLVYELPRVIEAEPDAAEELLDLLSTTRRPDVAEAIAALLGDCTHPSFGERAAGTLRLLLAQRPAEDNPAVRAVLERALRALSRKHVVDSGAGDAVRRALGAFETTGARAAYELAVEALNAAHEGVNELLGLDAREEQLLPQLIERLADLDDNVLERPRLANLLLLGRKPGDSVTSIPALERVHHRLAEWVFEHEQRASSPDEVKVATLISQRQLRALLHLIDLDTAHGDAEEDVQRIRGRMRRAAQVLLDRLAAGPDPSVHRILCATLARTFDASIREGVAEPSDLLLVLTRRLTDAQSMRAIAQATIHPDLAEGAAAYAVFLSGDADAGEIRNELESEHPIDPELLTAGRLVALSRGLSAGGSYRGEALRLVMLRLGRALESLAMARGLSELVDRSGSAPNSVGELESAADAIRQLQISAARRLFGDDGAWAITDASETAPLSNLIEYAVSSGTPPNVQQVQAAIAELIADLPPPLAEAIERVAARLDSLPIAGASDVFPIPIEKRRSALPDWLLPRRTIGAFYVVRALGSGGVSSVFVARRFEERHDSKAEAFALKVPEYDPTTARSLSEYEFLQMFREEAGALLSLPHHPNLARFVTFDLAARPKPILVMELIQGMGLDRLIRSRSLTADKSLRYLDGILAGLEAMHRVGVGHLDVKPSNVILRDGETPVLVDFGLSGRQLRPGCGTLEYCAPEVLGLVPKGHTALPPAADIYAFACTAFELLTTETLFDSENETSVVSLHVSHDGWPDKLLQLGRHPELKELSIILAACLRRDPRSRPGATAVRQALRDAAGKLLDRAWPFATESNRATG